MKKENKYGKRKLAMKKEIIIIDEAGKITEKMWRLLKRRLKKQKGKMEWKSTSFGKNWFYKFLKREL